MAWQFNSTQAVFIQIANRLRTDIIIGKYQPDEQLPTVRQLATEAAVNPNTVQKALQLLEDEGLLYTRATVGRFITPNVSVLSEARESLRRETVRAWLLQARELDISVNQMIDYIREENDAT